MHNFYFSACAWDEYICWYLISSPPPACDTYPHVASAVFTLGINRIIILTNFFIHFFACLVQWLILRLLFGVKILSRISFAHFCLHWTTISSLMEFFYQFLLPPFLHPNAVSWAAHAKLRNSITEWHEVRPTVFRTSLFKSTVLFNRGKKNSRSSFRFQDNSFIYLYNDSRVSLFTI